MLEPRNGDLLAAPAEALVNAVNTVGVMGKGIALQFRRKYPAMFEAYAKACAAGEVRIGAMQVFDRGARFEHPRWIINFPTKRHWREPSRMSDVEAGLPALVAIVRENNIRSVAVPALGCGLGGLSWDKIKPKIEAAFAPLADVKVLLYGPAGPAFTPALNAVRSPGTHRHQ